MKKNKRPNRPHIRTVICTNPPTGGFLYTNNPRRELTNDKTLCYDCRYRKLGFFCIAWSSKTQRSYY